MAKFKRTRPTESKTRREPSAKAIANFAAGAKKRPKRGRVKLDPDAPPTRGINLRLNDYELDLIKQLAESEDRSMQKVLKRVLIPVLEKAVSKIK